MIFTNNINSLINQIIKSIQIFKFNCSKSILENIKMINIDIGKNLNYPCYKIIYLHSNSKYMAKGHLNKRFKFSINENEIVIRNTINDWLCIKQKQMKTNFLKNKIKNINTDFYE